MRVFVNEHESLVKAKRECQLNWLCVGVHAYMCMQSNYEDWHWSLVGTVMKKDRIYPPSSLSFISIKSKRSVYQEAISPA